MCLINLRASSLVAEHHVRSVETRVRFPARPLIVVLDENLGKKLARELEKRGIEKVIAISTLKKYRGLPDKEVDALCRRLNAVLITKDYDFYTMRKGPTIYIKERNSLHNGLFSWEYDRIYELLKAYEK